LNRSPKQLPRIPEGIRSAVVSLFDNLPSETEPQRDALAVIRQAFYHELSKQFQPVVNRFAASQPQHTQEERSVLAVLLNQMTREMGLSLACPRTERPAVLVSEVKRERGTSTLRYRFYSNNDAGRRTASCTCYELPELTLCQAALRVEGLSRAYKKNKGGEQSR
jgi:hypothetical protein